MRLVFLGTGEFGVPGMRDLLCAGHEILAVIAQPDRPAGRGRDVHPTPVHAAATQYGLRHVPAVDVNAPEVLPLLAGAELGVVIAFGQKIGPGVLGALPRGCINLHASLLPKYRGAAPIQRAVLEGAETTGVTVFQLNERWDAGAIWAQRATPIGDTETAVELHDRLAELGATLLVDVIDGLAAGTLTPQTQDAAAATRAPKLTKADSAIDWDQPARRVARQINGLWSWPAAAAVFSGRGRPERVLLARALVADDESVPAADRPAGAFLPDRSVQTGPGRVRLLEVRPAGGKLMPFAAFANGRRIAPPDRLLPPESA